MDYAEGNILENKIRQIIREELTLFMQSMQEMEKKKEE